MTVYISPQRTYIAGQIVHDRAVKMAEEAYNCGQPFMDGLVAALMEHGAHTPEQRATSMREAMIRETLTNRMLTDKQREDYWREYNVPWWRKVWYRLRVRRLGYRVR